MCQLDDVAYQSLLTKMRSKIKLGSQFEEFKQKLFAWYGHLLSYHINLQYNYQLNFTIDRRSVSSVVRARPFTLNIVV